MRKSKHCLYFVIGREEKIYENAVTTLDLALFSKSDLIIAQLRGDIWLMK